MSKQYNILILSLVNQIYINSIKYILIYRSFVYFKVLILFSYVKLSSASQNIILKSFKQAPIYLLLYILYFINANMQNLISINLFFIIKHYILVLYSLQNLNLNLILI